MRKPGVCPHHFSFAAIQHSPVYRVLIGNGTQCQLLTGVSTSAGLSIEAFSVKEPKQLQMKALTVPYLPGFQKTLHLLMFEATVISRMETIHQLIILKALLFATASVRYSIGHHTIGNETIGACFPPAGAGCHHMPVQENSQSLPSPKIHL